MMLDLLPAFDAPTVTTAKVPGWTSRETMVCSRSTIEAARTTGSTELWGMEPWAPRPKTVIFRESPAERTGPAVVPIFPASVAITCWLRATSGRGTWVTRPSSTMAWAPAAFSSAGWNRAM